MQVHVCIRMCVCALLADSAVRVVCGGLRQKQSMLGFIIRVRGSPLAPVISQICPKAPKQCEREEGGNERTDGDTEMPRSWLNTSDVALKRGRKRGTLRDWWVLWIYLSLFLQWKHSVILNNLSIDKKMILNLNMRLSGSPPVDNK